MQPLRPIPHLFASLAVLLPTPAASIDFAHAMHPTNFSRPSLIPRAGNIRFDQQNPYTAMLAAVIVFALLAVLVATDLFTAKNILP